MENNNSTNISAIDNPNPQYNTENKNNEINEAEINILLVDDDKGILFTLRKLIEKLFPKLKIFTAYDGKAALSVIEQENISIIVSDLNMPIVTGMDLLRYIRSNKDYDSLYFIMVTANNDAENRRIALNLGADEFLSKPILTEALETRLKSAVRIVKMQMQLRSENIYLQASADDLEEMVQGMIKLSLKFLHARIPDASQFSSKVAESAIWVAEKINRFSRKEIRELELAAYFSQCGRFSLPDTLIKLPVLNKNGDPSSPIMLTLPAASREIVGNIPRFENIGNIVFSIYENLDGSGFPSHLRAWQIPLASRIIRVCLDYEELRFYGKYSQEEALNIMRRTSMQNYDNRVFVLFENYLKDNNEQTMSQEKMVTLSELLPNMIISRDIITYNGNKLISTGVKLTQSIIDKIIAISSADPILGGIYVKK